jgi:amiloride-sensitive sodium channel
MQINKTDLNDLCLALFDSFKFILHLPNEIPTLLHDSDHVDFSTATILRITAKTTKSENYLRRYSPEIRKCYFEGERKLKFFKAYTKNNCNFECLTNYTLRRCGCVSFFHLRTESTPVCDLENILCSRNALNMWPHLDEMSNTTEVPCSCFPSCSNIEYHIKKKKVTELGNKTSLFLIQELASATKLVKYFL